MNLTTLAWTIYLVGAAAWLLLTGGIPTPRHGGWARTAASILCTILWFISASIVLALALSDKKVRG